MFEAKISQPLIESFEKLTDFRGKRGVRDHLKPLLILLFLSKLGGADTSAEIADWVAFRFEQLKTLLALDWKRARHEVTWKRILERALKASEVEQCFGQYLQELAEEEKALLNLDGKVLCAVRAEESNQQLHLLAIAEAEKNLTLEQTVLRVSENEISAVKRLLAAVNLEEKIVSGDAIFAQTELGRKVVERGGDYLWKLRANQGSIYQLAAEYFERRADKYVDSARQLEKEHGRIDEREIVTSFRLAGELELPSLAQVFRIRRQSEQVKTGRRSEQTIDGITWLGVSEFRAAELLEITRKHWRIENGLHYRRDVTFKEDRVRKHSRCAGQIMAALNNLAIGLLRKLGWENIAKARRFYNAQIEKGLELITQPILA